MLGKFSIEPELRDSRPRDRILNYPTQADVLIDHRELFDAVNEGVTI